MGRGGRIWLAVLLRRQLPRQPINLLGSQARPHLCLGLVGQVLSPALSFCVHLIQVLKPTVNHLHNPFGAEQPGALLPWGSVKHLKEHIPWWTFPCYWYYTGVEGIISPSCSLSPFGCGRPLFGSLTRGGSEFQRRNSVETRVGWIYFY